jgi:Zn-finger nucleic acid-binding protein
MAELQNEDGVQMGAETANACPACQTLLSDGTIQNKSVLYCTKCRGLLVAIDIFLPLVEFLRALRPPAGSNIEPRDDSDADRKLTCPMCYGTMEGHPYGGPGNVNIDTCEHCSVVWLDHDELQRIVVAPDHTSLYSRYDSAGELRREPRR